MRLIYTDSGNLIVNGIELSIQQTKIVEYDGNIVVSASAGTGKTRTMVSKIIYDLEKNKTHRVIAAITFTIKAAQEIRDRLTVDISQNFIGTNNSFAIEEIIKPFMKDVYGEDFDKDFDTDYEGKRDFCFTSGIRYLQSEGILGKCRKETPCESHKDKPNNFIFELALDIAKKSKACQLFLKAKYFGIYIDEYQDCDSEMHNLFMYLCNDLGIRTFVVGDDKQSIYRWRGAKPELFIGITENNDFEHFILTDNHRSCVSIQNYSNLLFKKTAELYMKSENKNEIIIVDRNTEDWASVVVSLLDSRKSSALLRNYDKKSYFGKESAMCCSQILKQKGTDFTYIPTAPIEDITTKTAWLYMAVARFIVLDNFTVFDFINEVPVEGDIENKSVSSVEKYLNNLNKVFNDEQKFHPTFRLISELFGYELIDTSDENIDKLFETVNDKQYIVSVSRDLPLHCAMTIHKSKGLEFDQTIIFLEDYGYNFSVNPSHINNHYVACTRAKSKLIIVDSTHSDAQAVRSKLKELFAKVDYHDFLSKSPTTHN